jgi:formylglycine-generating enzyme required for sulfatase activity
MIRLQKNCLLLIAAATAIFSQSIPVTGGSFTMGCANGSEDERPGHAVTLSSFNADKTEVTEAAYDACVQSGRCTPAHYTDGKCKVWKNGAFVNVLVPQERRGPDLPVVCVTWYQADAYCKSYGKKLPSEAQWEYMASSGKTDDFSWGNDPPDESRCAQPSNSKPDNVCSHAVNGFNLCDMTGNVWEWTNDYYARDYYTWSEAADPSGPEVGLYRVIRGGGWYSTGSQLRVQNRNWSVPDFADVSVGFRCVKR